MNNKEEEQKYLRRLQRIKIKLVRYAENKQTGKGGKPKQNKK